MHPIPGRAELLPLGICGFDRHLAHYKSCCSCLSNSVKHSVTRLGVGLPEFTFLTGGHLGNNSHACKPRPGIVSLDGEQTGPDPSYLVACANTHRVELFRDLPL